MKLLSRLFGLWARADRWHIALTISLLVMTTTAIWCAHEAVKVNRAFAVHLIQYHILPKSHETTPHP